MTLFHYVVSHPSEHSEKCHGVGNDNAKIRINSLFAKNLAEIECYLQIFHFKKKKESHHTRSKRTKGQMNKWTGTFLNLYFLMLNFYQAHKQISTGIRAQLVAYINFADCLHSCPYISDKRMSFGYYRQNFVVY